MPSIQYPIALPRDFRMRELEERAEQKAAVFETWPGLRMKAFLVTSLERGDAGNGYAPFYVWRSAQALSDFLAGPVFDGVVERFGRPAVHQRQVLEFAVADRALSPQVATFEDLPMAGDVRPLALQREEAGRHREALDRPGLHSAAALLDTATWTVTRVRFWAADDRVRGVAADARRFRVLRVVGPALSGVEAADS